MWRPFSRFGPFWVVIFSLFGIYLGSIWDLFVVCFHYLVSTGVYLGSVLTIWGLSGAHFHYSGFVGSIVTVWRLCGVYLGLI